MESYVRLSIVVLVVLVPIAANQLPFRRVFVIVMTLVMVYWLILMLTPTSVLI